MEQQGWRTLVRRGLPDKARSANSWFETGMAFIRKTNNGRVARLSLVILDPPAEAGMEKARARSSDLVRERLDRVERRNAQHREVPQVPGKDGVAASLCRGGDGQIGQAG